MEVRLKMMARQEACRNKVEGVGGFARLVERGKDSGGYEQSLRYIQRSILRRCDNRRGTGATGSENQEGDTLTGKDTQRHDQVIETECNESESGGPASEKSAVKIHLKPFNHDAPSPSQLSP